MGIDWTLEWGIWGGKLEPACLALGNDFYGKGDGDGGGGGGGDGGGRDGAKTKESIASDHR